MEIVENNSGTMGSDVEKLQWCRLEPRATPTKGGKR